MAKYILKILVAGDGAVGKTTLLYRYVEGFFRDTRQMTIGIEFHLKNIEIENHQIQLLLNDFAGQERFRFMIDQWIHGAHGALVLYDITNMVSFNNIKEWVSLVRKEKQDLPVLLVASKCDLDDSAIVADDAAEEICNQLNLQAFIKTSSKADFNVSISATSPKKISAWSSLSLFILDNFLANARTG